MNMRLSSLLLAMSLATSSLALAEGTAAPAAAPQPGATAPAPKMGPMMGPNGSHPMMGPSGSHSMMGPNSGHPMMDPGYMHGKMNGKRKGAAMHRQPLESFTEETVRKLDDGRVFKRSIEQKVSDGSFTRKEVFTNPDGKSATRTVTSSLGKDGKTWTQKMEGVDFEGKPWSRSRDVPARQGPDASDEAPASAPAATRPARPGKGG